MVSLNRINRVILSVGVCLTVLNLLLFLFIGCELRKQNNQEVSRVREFERVSLLKRNNMTSFQEMRQKRRKKKLLEETWQRFAGREFESDENNNNNNNNNKLNEHDGLDNSLQLHVAVKREEANKDNQLMKKKADESVKTIQPTTTTESKQNEGLFSTNTDGTKEKEGDKVVTPDIKNSKDIIELGTTTESKHAKDTVSKDKENKISNDIANKKVETEKENLHIEIAKKTEKNEESRRIKETPLQHVNKQLNEIEVQHSESKEQQPQQLSKKQHSYNRETKEHPLSKQTTDKVPDEQVTERGTLKKTEKQKANSNQPTTNASSLIFGIDEKQAVNDSHDMTTAKPNEVEKTDDTKEKLKNGARETQQCVLPKLDPFHPDIRPHISYEWKNKCNLKRQAKILEGGRLHLKLENVQRAGFYYIRRRDDFRVDLSGWHSLMKDDAETTLTKGASGCLRVFEGNMAVAIRDDPKEKVLLTSNSRELHCPASRQLSFRENGEIVHNDTCLMVDQAGKLSFPMASSSCNGIDSTFDILNDGTIQHRSTKQCLRHRHPDSFELKACDMEATHFYLQSNKQNSSVDLDVIVQLTEDFVRLDLIYSHKSKTEYHVFPVRKASEKVVTRKDEQLNVIMVMFDSISRSDAQRYMNRTYGMLEKDADSVILKGHTINGDGTTPQLCTLLTGKQEHELPEARRGYPNSAAIDRWNFIFNDFTKRGYKTLFSEDEPIYNAFHYRLHGFKNPPTDKYLRPWWMAADRMIGQANGHSRACSHEIGLDYLKNFLNLYDSEPTFSYLVSSSLTHSESPRIALADEDIVDFYDRFLSDSGYRNNSLVIIHGDHGNRLSKFRTSIQGKLEERLPFVAMSLPPWFKQKYPTKFRNLRKNADVLTTYYDLHVTLKDILDFPNSEYKHEYGKSLFSNIVKVNRTCKDAGIDEHWCPCLTFSAVNISDSIIQTVAKEMVSIINKKMKQYKESEAKCALLRLDKIVRASKSLPNARVQKYEKTHAVENCDNCGVTLNDNYTANEITYELVFRVSPSNALFEATADVNLKTNKVTVNDNISRLNMYGDQPNCVAKGLPYLRPFCYCKK